MNETRTMGQRIRSARLERGLSVTQLAALCDVRERTVVRWENDDNVPLGKYLRVLAGALDVSPLWLLGDPDGDAAEAMVA